MIETIQRTSIISFPMFGNFSINPPSYFTVFGFDIYFYGVFIALGFMCGTLYCAKKSEAYGLTEDDVYDFLLWLLPMSILGARLYYVAFRLDYYLQHMNEFFAVWEGGLAIYGGVIAGIITAFFVCKVKKIPVLAMLDLVVFGLIIGQIIGRWGNFMNREAFGAQTEVFCRMGLTAPDGTTIFVHPTFLYESLWNLVGLVFLMWFNKKGLRRYEGQNLLIYFLWYGIGRTWIEGLRTDSLYIGSSGIRVSQALSIVLALSALVILFIQSRREHDPEKLFVNKKNQKEEITYTEETNNV